MLALFALACNLNAGSPHAVEGQVLEAGGTSVVLRQPGLDGVLEPGDQALTVDPNLARQVQPGDRVHANLLVTPQGDVRAIGFEVLGHEPLEQARVLSLGEPFPRAVIPTPQGDMVVGVGQDGPVILTFLFTSCPLPAFCPLLAFKLEQLQSQVAGRAQILSITLDPANDSLDVLRDYGATKGADPAVWRFGRVELDQLESLLTYAGAGREELDGDITHSLRIVLLDAQGQVAWSASDNSWDVDHVASLVAALPQDAR